MFTVLAVCVILGSLIQVGHSSPSSKHVTISIIIDIGQTDQALTFLENFNYTKWSIVLSAGLIDQGILDNASFVQRIKVCGELLPSIWMAQVHDNAWKKQIVDNYTVQWETKVGYRPYGFFMWQPDTYITNYLYSLGILYVEGYCFDQYAVDYMTMRGGWQQPYFVSATHVFVPAAIGQGLVVLPHIIWDYRDSFELDHQYNSQPIDTFTMFNGNYTESRQYVMDLMDEVLTKTEPTAYFTSQNEIYGWNGQFANEAVFNNTDFFWSIIREARSQGANLEMFNETASQFKAQFAENPVYTVKDFISPYSGKKSEWLWNTKERITRFDDYVVGFVNYTEQQSDPFLERSAVLQFGNSHDPTQCVDNSLNFTIDDYGNGTYRAPPKGNRVSYVGKLENYTLGDSELPEYPTSFLFPFLVIMAIIASARIFTRRRDYRKHTNSSFQYFFSFHHLTRENL